MTPRELVKQAFNQQQVDEAILDYLLFKASKDLLHQLKSPTLSIDTTHDGNDSINRSLTLVAGSIYPLCSRGFY